MESPRYSDGPGKGAVSKTEGKKGRHQRRYLVITLAIAAIHIISLTAAIIPGGLVERLSHSALAAPPSSSSGVVEYPQALFNDGKAHYFDYKTPDGLTVRYFIIRSSDGVIRAAFDACDVCWPAGKGYAQKGDNMICRNCGRQFPSTKINVVTGGCNPSALKREMKGDKVVVQVKDIVEGKRYFDFKGAKR